MGILKKVKVAVFGWPANVLEGAARHEGMSPEQYEQATLPPAMLEKIKLMPGGCAFRTEDLLDLDDGEDSGEGDHALAIISR